MTDLKPETAGNAPEPWMPIVQQIHSHKPILACPKCNATSDRQASKMCSGNEDNCPMDGADWIERIVKLNIETIASGFFGDPSGASSQEATPRKCDCGADQDDEDVRCWRCGAEPAPSPEENELNDFLANFDCPCCGFPKCGHEHEADVQALFQAEIDRLKAICAKSKEPAPSPATKHTMQGGNWGDPFVCTGCRFSTRSLEEAVNHGANGGAPSPATKETPDYSAILYGSQGPAREETPKCWRCGRPCVQGNQGSWMCDCTSTPFDCRKAGPETPRKKFFIDTEFIESGPSRPVELLSIGIVCEDGRELYAVNTDANLSSANDWVKANVIPHLLRYDALKVGEPRRTRESLREYVREFVGDCKPEFWGYYADYDWVVFAQIFGTMMDLPKGWPMYCRDLKQLCDERGNPELPAQSSTEHNALNDARWNMQAYQFLQSFDAGAKSVVAAPQLEKENDNATK